jgi:hypothetical protein
LAAINPAALGLDHSWLDGIWRNIYNWTLPGRSTKENPNIGLVEHEIEGAKSSFARS